MSKKGIVCEIKKEYCVFLTPDGQFVRGIPLLTNVQIGDEAEFNVVAKKTSPVKRALFPIIASAAALMLLFATVLNPAQSVHAYVQVEGMEKVEFGVDESGQILEVRPLSDGQMQIETDFYKGKQVESVIEDILTSEELIVPVAITTVFTKKAENREKKLIEQAISNVKNKFDENEVAVYQATEKDRNEANEKGVAIQQFLKPKQKSQNDNDKNSNHGVKAGHKKDEDDRKTNPPKSDNGNNLEQSEKQQPKGKPDVKEKQQSNPQKDPEKKKNNRNQNNEPKSNGMDKPDKQNGRENENKGKDQGQGKNNNGQGQIKEKDNNKDKNNGKDKDTNKDKNEDKKNKGNGD